MSLEDRKSFGNISRSKMAGYGLGGGLKRLRTSAATFGERDQSGSEGEHCGQTSVLGEIVWRCKPGSKRPVRRERARGQ